ncbi:MAG: hypothetical protein ACXACA_03370 [Candidatus Ranarchaeia archaeon]|jgi:hypothetical protein
MRHCKQCELELNRQKMFCSRRCKADYEKTTGKEKIVSKIRDTFIDRYGVTPIEKKNEVMLVNHGTTHALQVESSNRKMKKTMVSRFGTESTGLKIVVIWESDWKLNNNIYDYLKDS